MATDLLYRRVRPWATEETRMKTLLLLLISTTSWGFNQTSVRSIQNPTAVVKKAIKSGYGIPYQERAIKTELVSLKRKSPKVFQEKLQNGIANPDFYQSYLLEIRDGLSKVERAKIIAKATLTEAIFAKWPELQKSILNQNADTKWLAFSYNLKRNINKNLVYKPDNKKMDFTFETGEWGRVIVAKNLRSAKWSLDVGSYLDGNRLEPGAENIKTDDEGPTFEPAEDEPAAPVAAPILAEGERKTIVPQLKKSMSKNPLLE